MTEEINEEVIQDERKLLRFFCRAVQLLGWALLVMGVIWFVCLVSLPSSGDEVETILQAISWFLFAFTVPGVAAIGIIQFVRYLFDTEYKPGWVLRHAAVFIYLLAAIEIAWAIFRYFYFVRTMDEPTARLLWTQLLILPTIVKVMILVSLAQILKRILPLIEESKTLV
ncbi:MAG: hypothetical protein ACYSYT_06300 [Planctomycetota bacterium]|jgi:hypothetical protein